MTMDPFQFDAASPADEPEKIGTFRTEKVDGTDPLRQNQILPA